ncbi:MAG: ABC transporter ATP-binding protein [Acidimicrobiia bacterium]|nr:ABC transporter ATP-binding protein [Acidimicrobiia bacterium]MDH5420911.1 ABC transporter ATP-binding protein [Acidimicrobiia bacterium]MDH5503230.1 ABC transporter ATP-binding protein [Acidimicrobiia bacterium]
MSSIVSLRDVHVHFGASRAVDGVSVDVKPGEVLALVGESGSGKTTLIRAVQGLQPVTAGEIIYTSAAGATAGPGRGNRGVQMIFQDPTGALNPRQTIYEIVAEGLRIRKESQNEVERVGRALSRAGLRPPERFFPMYPHQISGGQRQRVVIAGAMVMEPDLLLADEPVASLDASIRGEILALMLELVGDTGLSILVVTHDLGLAWNIADRVAVMYLGRIVELGPTEQILGEPRHPYTRALLSVVPETTRMEQQILVGEIPDSRRVPVACRFHPRCPLLQSGMLPAEVASRCTTEDPGPVDRNAGSAAACWAVT